jgi:hypothetical protein
MSSNTKASLPVGSSYNASVNLTMFACGFDVGHNFLRAYISGREFTYSRDLK